MDIKATNRKVSCIITLQVGSRQQLSSFYRCRSKPLVVYWDLKYLWSKRQNRSHGRGTAKGCWTWDQSKIQWVLLLCILILMGYFRKPNSRFHCLTLVFQVWPGTPELELAQQLPVLQSNRVTRWQLLLDDNLYTILSIIIQLCNILLDDVENLWNQGKPWFRNYLSIKLAREDSP